MGKTKNVQADANKIADADELFAALRPKATELEGAGDRDKLTVSEPGEYFISRLVKIGKSAQENERGERFSYYHFDGQGKSERFFFVGSFDFDSRVKHEHIGKVLAVRLVELVDMGKQSPMKLYDILDMGTTFPELGGVPAIGCDVEAAVR